VILVDTGPIVAAASQRDRHHSACLAALSDLADPPLITPLAVMEVCYLLSTRATPAAEAAFLRSVAVGSFELVTLTADDLLRSASLVEQYGDLPLGAADASIVAVAERLGIRRVMPLDRKHFSIVRPRHVDAFELLP
jgi:predicted nucleic acid-binding protein